MNFPRDATRRIGEFVRFDKGKAPKETFETPGDGRLPYLSPEFLRGAAPPLYVVSTERDVLVAANDPIILWDGSNAGEVFFAKPGVLASTMTRLLPENDELDPAYLGHALKLHESYLKALTAGSGIPHVDKVIVKRLLFWKPGKPEQQSVSDAISLANAAISAVGASIEKAERLQKALMQQLLSGHLKTDGTPRTANEFWIDPKLGLVPKGWIVEKGWKLAEKITKGQSPKWQGFDYTQSGMLFVTSENVRDGFLDLTEPKFLPVEFNEKIKNSELRTGDILINLVGASIGRSCVFSSDYSPANINQAVCLFRPKQGIVSRYLAYCLRLPAILNRLLSSQVETARANLSLGDVRRLKFVLPQDEGEQRQIAEHLHAITRLIEAKQQKIATLQRLKKSLMQNLLTGRLRLPVENAQSAAITP